MRDLQELLVGSAYAECADMGDMGYSGDRMAGQPQMGTNGDHTQPDTYRSDDLEL